MSSLYLLGLPSREFVRSRLAARVSPIDMRRIHWIRVAHQLAGIMPRGTLYVLPESRIELGMPQHHELEQMLRVRRWQLVDVTPELVAVLIEQLPRVA